MDRLFVCVLGNRNSGKTKTWHTLFGKPGNTRKYVRPLEVSDQQAVNVFLVNGSFEERNINAGKVLDNQDCRIVLCSVQSNEKGRETIQYALDQGFTVFCQWLNPGYSDSSEVVSRYGFPELVFGNSGYFSMRDGKKDPKPRVEEIRQFIFGWASARDLTYPH